MHRRTFVAAALAVIPASGCLGLGESSDDEQADGDGETDGDGTDDGSRDEPLDASGTIEILVDDEPVDLTRDRFQAEHAEGDVLAFHLHEGSEEWFMEGRDRVSFGEGLNLLPHVSFEHDAGQHRLVVDGSEYDERDIGTEIEFRVDGEAVDPTSYELYDGDELVVEVATGS